MPLEMGDRTATVTGSVTVEEVEVLVRWLRETRRPRVNLRRCTHLHTGALQALMLFRPKVSAPPVDHFLADHVMPLLEPEGTEPSDLHDRWNGSDTP